MIVFLDVDGTYADHSVVPEAHIDAIRQARAEGHHVLLCTGRPASMLTDLLAETEFDGVVAGAGAYVAVKGEVLRDQRFPADLADRAVDILDAHDVTYILESPERVEGPPGIAARLENMFKAIAAKADGKQIVPTSLFQISTTQRDRGTSFGKITVFHAPMPVEELGELIGPEVAVLPSSLPDLGASAGEIFLANVHKALGAELATKALGGQVADTVAVGDGLNDLEVLKWAGTGVAIEGAPPELMAVADRTTPGPQLAGIAQLFKEMGLLGTATP